MISAEHAKTANWICAALAIVILLVRLVSTRHRDKAFDVASVFVFASLVVVVIRIVAVYLYLLYGTSNDVVYSQAKYFDSSDLATIKAGSILALIARFLITTFYWLQICLLLLFYSRLLRDIHWNAVAIKACWLTIVATYIAVTLATFLECRPFHLYWQVSPPPGKCVRAYAQIFSQGAANMILDLLLLVISFPLLTVRHRTWSQRFRVGILFTLGFFCIIIVCIRLAYVFGDGYQPVRSFWASVQMLVSTFVANTPTIYGCWQLAQRRKSEQRERQASRPELWLQLTQSPSNSGRELTPPAIAHPARSRSWDEDEKGWARLHP